MRKHLWIDPPKRSRRQLSLNFGIDELRFEVAYWYSDVDFYDLEERFGREYMSKIYFHLVMFEANKLVSLRPETIDLGELACLYTRDFDALWRTVIQKVWAQWRYENNLPDYHGPEFTCDPVRSATKPAAIHRGEVDVLSFCGGGKDSLVAMKLLDRAEIPYSSFAYSNSIYGTTAPQHALIEGLLRHGRAVKQHQQWVYDSFVDSPVLQLYPEYRSKSLAAAETPASIFGALPIVLQHGYRHIALAHERSANAGNLIWEATGEEVNHQWGKSLAAELLLNRYIQNELIANFTYFSILQPVYDVLIFNMLRRDLQAVQDTHSCNVRKPWCGKCAKCAYVWLNFLAYLPKTVTDSICSSDLFDEEENQRWFHQMLGLAEHTPFECIGQVPETRLAFELCRRKGYTGKAIDMYSSAFPQLDHSPIIEKYLSISRKQSNMPAEIAAKIFPQFEAGAEEARRYFSERLKRDA